MAHGFAQHRALAGGGLIVFLIVALLVGLAHPSPPPDAPGAAQVVAGSPAWVPVHGLHLVGGLAGIVGFLALASFRLGDRERGLARMAGAAAVLGLLLSAGAAIMEMTTARDLAARAFAGGPGPVAAFDGAHVTSLVMAAIGNLLLGTAVAAFGIALAPQLGDWVRSLGLAMGALGGVVTVLAFAFDDPARNLMILAGVLLPAIWAGSVGVAVLSPTLGGRIAGRPRGATP